MKAYRLEVLIIDHDDVGPDGIVAVIENTRYPNRCIDPIVEGVAVADIGEWHDDHPLNGPAHTTAYIGLEWVLDRIVVAQAREVAEPDTTPNFTRANLHEPIERALASFALMLSDLFLGKTEDTFIQIRARAVDHILNLVDYHSMSPEQRTLKERSASPVVQVVLEGDSE